MVDNPLSSSGHLLPLLVLWSQRKLKRDRVFWTLVFPLSLLAVNLTHTASCMKSQLLSKVFFLPLHCCLRMTTMNLSDIPFSSERCFIEFRSRLCQSSTPNSLINVYMDLALCTGSSHVGTGRASHKLFPQRALNCTKYLGMLKR